MSLLQAIAKDFEYFVKKYPTTQTFQYFSQIYISIVFQCVAYLVQVSLFRKAEKIMKGTCNDEVLRRMSMKKNSYTHLKEQGGTL